MAKCDASTCEFAEFSSKWRRGFSIFVANPRTRTVEHKSLSEARLSVRIRFACGLLGEVDLGGEVEVGVDLAQAPLHGSR